MTRIALSISRRGNQGESMNVYEYSFGRSLGKCKRFLGNKKHPLYFEKYKIHLIVRDHLTN